MRDEERIKRVAGRVTHSVNSSASVTLQVTRTGGGVWSVIVTATYMLTETMSVLAAKASLSLSNCPTVPRSVLKER